MSQKRKQMIGEENEQFFYSLHSLLKQMIYTRKTNPWIYQKLTQLLISGQKDCVIEYILNAIISCFIKDKPKEELIFSNPNSVASFFVNITREYPWIFEHELIHSDKTKRYRMVLILRSMFSLKKDLPTINIARELKTRDSFGIWDAFVSRFTDFEPQIRTVCVQTAEVLLQTQIDEQIVTDLQINLTNRFRDTIAAIRSDCADAVDKTADIKPANILDRNLMKHFIGRIGDKVFDIRKRVLICVSNVFYTIIRKFPETEETFVYKLPSGCLLRYGPNIELEEKSLIETIFSNNLIDLRADNSTKMNRLIKLICFCEDIAVKAITQIFHNQKRLRLLLLNFILTIETNNFNVLNIKEESHKRIIEKIYRNFSYIENIESVINHFHHLLANYSTKLNDLKHVFECKIITNQQSIQLIEHFFNTKQKVIDREIVGELKEEILLRCGIGFIDSKSMISLFNQMKTVDQKFAKRLASLIILLSIVYTDHFNDESVISELLHLPPVIIAFIVNDSMLPFIKCSQRIKDELKEFVAQNSHQINKSISSSPLI